MNVKEAIVDVLAVLLLIGIGALFWTVAIGLGALWSWAVS